MGVAGGDHPAARAVCLERRCVSFCLACPYGPTHDFNTRTNIDGRLKELALLGEPCCGTSTCTVLYADIHAVESVWFW